MLAATLSDIVGLNDRECLRNLFYQEIGRRVKRGGNMNVGTVSRIKPSKWLAKTPYYHPLLIAEGTTLNDVVTKSSEGGYTFVPPHTSMGRFGGGKTIPTLGGIYSISGKFVRYVGVRTVFGTADTNREGSTQKFTIDTPHYRDISEFKDRHHLNRLNPIGHSGIECLNTNIGTDKVGSKRKNWTHFTVPDLKRRAKWNGIKGGHKMRKNQLIFEFMKL